MYKYPDAEFWLKYMKPSDIAFVLLYSYTHQYENIIESRLIDGDNTIQLIFGGDYRESTSFNLCIGINPDTERPYVWINGSCLGFCHYNKNRSSTQQDITLTEIEIEEIEVYYKKRNVDHDIVLEDDNILYDEIVNLAKMCAEKHVPDDSDVNLPNVKFPASLKQRIEMVIKTNSKSIERERTSKKFGI